MSALHKYHNEQPTMCDLQFYRNEHTGNILFLHSLPKVVAFYLRKAEKLLNVLHLCILLFPLQLYCFKKSYMLIFLLITLSYLVVSVNTCWKINAVAISVQSLSQGKYLLNIFFMDFRLHQLLLLVLFLFMKHFLKKLQPQMSQLGGEMKGDTLVSRKKSKYHPITPQLYYLFALLLAYFSFHCSLKLQPSWNSSLIPYLLSCGKAVMTFAWTLLPACSSIQTWQKCYLMLPDAN